MISTMVAWLVSEENSFTTGAVFDLSGVGALTDSLQLLEQLHSNQESAAFPVSTGPTLFNVHELAARLAGC